MPHIPRILANPAMASHEQHRMSKSLGTIVEFLHRSAQFFPNHPAITDRGASCTYAELASRTNAFAARLGSMAFKKADRVAILAPSGPGFAAAYYGALQAGAIVVPLGMLVRATEIEHILDHCNAKVLVIDSDYPELHAVTDAAVRLGTRTIMAGELLSMSHTGHATLTPVPTDDACILYTSGTTGRPKGVLLSHKGIAANTTAIVKTLALSQADSTLTGLPFNYSFGCSVLNSHIAVGSQIFIAPPMVFPERVLESISSWRPASFYGVPSTFAMLLARTDPSEAETSSLRFVAQAGGAMPAALQSQVRAAFPSAGLYLMYGQTEATARISVLSQEQSHDKSASVGKPLAGTQVSIRDSSGAELPTGQSGEIWVRGPGVMRGYWRDPELSAETLQDGWLRSGDQGHVDAEGFLFIDGRRSDIIKSGAYRIHPAEIEEALLALPFVEDAGVIGRPDTLLGEIVVAFIVARAGMSPSEDELRKHCKKILSSYKVPAVFRFVDMLPRTANGKLRRQELTTW